MRPLTAIIILFLACAEVPAPSMPVEPGPKLRPFDEAPSDPSFVTFRTELLDAIRRRDQEHLLSVLHPRIRVSFGDDGGVEGFQRYWKLDETNTTVWKKLEDLLSLGGSFRSFPDGRQMFCAPYVYSAYPEDGPDAFESLVVTGDRIELREEPSRTARVIALLEYHIVKIAAEDPMRAGKTGQPEWRKIVTASGKEGWIEERVVRSPIDYRACFEKMDQDWKMVLLVAGD